MVEKDRRAHWQLSPVGSAEEELSVHAVTESDARELASASLQDIAFLDPALTTCGRTEGGSARETGQREAVEDGGVQA